MLKSGIRSIKVKNWKNIPDINIEEIGDFSVLTGPNASGKSNFLDIILFLRDISKNGLQFAVNQRGGMEKIRSLSANRDTDISIETEILLNGKKWLYKLVINKKPKLAGIPVSETSKAYIKEEKIIGKDYNVKINRKADGENSDLVTYLETPFKNTDFKVLVDYFLEIDLLHIVPQMVKERQIKDTEKKELDVYGRNFFEKIGKTPKQNREKYLSIITRSLKGAIPHFEELMIEQDINSGVFHLVARFKNWRAPTAKHNELFLSDGTIRIIGILWTLLEKKNGILLIDEPEISLHSAIIKSLPRIIAQIQFKSEIQVVVTTHAYEFLNQDSGLKTKDIFIVTPGENGKNVISGLSSRLDAKNLLASGFSFQEVLTSITSNQTSLEL